MNGTWTLRVRDGRRRRVGADHSREPRPDRLDRSHSFLVNIPDGAGTGPRTTARPGISRSRSAASAGGSPTDVALAMTVTHPFVGDLEATLIAPGGTSHPSSAARAPPQQVPEGTTPTSAACTAFSTPRRELVDRRGAAGRPRHHARQLPRQHGRRGRGNGQPDVDHPGVLGAHDAEWHLDSGCVTAGRAIPVP